MPILSHTSVIFCVFFEYRTMVIKFYIKKQGENSPCFFARKLFCHRFLRGVLIRMGLSAAMILFTTAAIATAVIEFIAQIRQKILPDLFCGLFALQVCANGYDSTANRHQCKQER